MNTQDRMYVVTHKPTGTVHLRIAPNAAQALRNVTAAEYETRIPSSIEVSRLVISGVMPISVREVEVIE